MRKNIVLRNANIIHHNGKIELNKDIHIEAGKIKRIDKHEEGEGIDCSNPYVTPGLVNLHVHSPMNIFKGITEDVNIDDWFNKEVETASKNMYKYY